MGHSERNEGDGGTHQLKSGNVGLPPKVVVAHGRQHVVQVHRDVHEAVDEADERPVPARHVLDAAPRHDGHHSMVVQVQKTHLERVIVNLKTNKQ